MACDNLYTKEEIIAKLKEIDTQLDLAITKTSLDTGQSKHDISQSTRVLREQYEKYAAMLQRIDPACYRTIFGDSVIKFERGYRC